MERQNNRTWITVFAGIAMTVSALSGCGRIRTDAGIGDTTIGIVSEIAEETELVGEITDIAESQNSIGNDDEETQPAETVEETEPEISLVMVGDILLHTPVAKSGVQEDGSYDFDAVFAKM